MNFPDRTRVHQLHPAKLAVDGAGAALAGGLLWAHQPVSAAVLGFGPSLLVTLLFLSGPFDRALESVRARPGSRATAANLSVGVDALRFLGLALFWAGCWLRRAWLIPVGLAVIAVGWRIAWRRGAAGRARR